MDLSPVQSSAKCGSSDFSIERILSEDSSRENTAQVPSWLCCTRYQPPRLPRASSACRSRRSGRHARVPFTGAQAAALEAAYSRAPYLAPPALRALAAALQLRDDRIKIWFQNRRARERREKSGCITPPQAVTLPSTASPPMTPTTAWIPITNRPLQTTSDSFIIQQNTMSNFVRQCTSGHTSPFVRECTDTSGHTNPFVRECTDTSGHTNPFVRECTDTSGHTSPFIRECTDTSGDMSPFVRECTDRSGSNGSLCQSYSTSDESNGSRSNSPLDVETVD